MKKLKKVLIGVLATLTLVAGFTACEALVKDDSSEKGHRHSYESEITKQPDCENEGEKTYTCDCGDSFTRDIFPALGHSYENGKCIRCGISDGLKYRLNSDRNSYSVFGVDNRAVTDLIIPSMYNNLPVTSIDNSAFSSCDSLTSVVIGDSVTSIGEDAFYRCESLTSVEIPDSVTSIGDWAFYWCSSLTSVEIPDSVTSIGDRTFCNCSSLTSITFNGTIAQWNAIVKGDYWRLNIPATEVVCSDGVVAI